MGLVAWVAAGTAAGLAGTVAGTAVALAGTVVGVGPVEPDAWLVVVRTG